MAESLEYASPRAGRVKSGMVRGIVMFAIVRSVGFLLFSSANGGPGVFASVKLLAVFVGCLLVSSSAGFSAALWILRPQGGRGRPRVMGLSAASALVSFVGSVLWPSLFWRTLSPANLDGRVVMIFACAEFFVGFIAGTAVLGAYRIWFDRRTQ